MDVAAQRAKQLRRGALPRLERGTPGPHKLERVAMEEVRTGVIHYTLPDELRRFTARGEQGVRPVLAVAEAFAVSIAVLLISSSVSAFSSSSPRLRRRGRETYFTPDAPHGPVDQLRTPELLESRARTSAEIAR